MLRNPSGRSGDSVGAASASSRIRYDEECTSMFSRIIVGQHPPHMAPKVSICLILKNCPRQL